jgi:hypothetical protein
MHGLRTLSVRASAALAALACVTLTVGGCASVKPPPVAKLKDPVPVYLGDFGIHSALFLPTPDGRYVEYIFSDWEYSAKDHDNLANGMFALAGVSKGSAFGRQYHDCVAGGDEPCLKKKPETLRRVWAERLDVYDLIWRLDLRWRELAEQNGGPPVVNADGVAFVRHPARYSVANNCNHLTAKSLRELGCDVNGVIVWANFEVINPREPAPPLLPSVSIRPILPERETVGTPAAVPASANRPGASGNIAQAE